MHDEIPPLNALRERAFRFRKEGGYAAHPIEAALSRLPGLVEAGAVESQGRGRGTRYHLSRNFYATLGRSGATTRKKGLDHETNKALLEKHLIDSGTGGAPMADLLQVLPALSRAHLKRLLDELRTEDRAHLTGEKRGARWSFPKNRRYGSTNQVGTGK
ncbi:MAG: hypothetical protein CAK90_07625 [Spartobacteria bacterium AMD-G4]|nr:MAG: hypothetical protein CAK90_07625 [Spartobacteria bacterium AMD-G4]